MADNTTITFVVTLVVAFVFLRWFVNSEESEVISPLDQLDVASGDTDATGRANHDAHPIRRAVTTDMVEVVQSIAPHLSVEQIQYDLQRTGSVQETVERVLSEGTLPYPPGYTQRSASSGATRNDTHEANGDRRNKVDNIKSENLLKKYNVDEMSSSDSSSVEKKTVKAQWSDSPDVRAKTLQEKKAEMILKARKRLQAQLSNEQDLSVLTE
ncbi:unnamed protein product [Cyberlindnera jadinii]|uniref:Coupling of ubiquitin conjugation to ER degradation protein 1 n=1 Tax=Cyberlindnera jadinii (strain ATCC 18201 / CBS 1600 / BCRC 20928 / JCM 3617 / NBRC 0987 / NRRL Y-1542) TaxID=983966 RepID=A0A0H5C479_CYBJN|nr:hypothetical protein CYBJADRAFT_171325 [Cyberlindnera jadinii NRRL Y-1542]ODV75405.1 hypothetical protein CYBJADRAFT_171325 [Cyberlindnera jadinii NRRL Y-1542]CEP22547.1 unnamed protein product [Cyberlindnera jadinii]